MIRYSPLSGRAQARFLRAYNDIDIFVEDSATPNVYVRLIRRILPRGTRLGSVIPLGDKSSVITSCADDQAARARARLYIIDGDLDLLCGIPKRRLKHLYRLPVYCIENVTVSEHAAVCLAEEGLPNMTYDALKNALACSLIIESVEKRIFPLFLVYAISHKLQLPFPTVSYSVHHLLQNTSDPFSLDRGRVRARMRVLIEQIKLSVSEHRYRSAKRAVQRVARSRRHRLLDFISAKQYVLPLIQLQLQQVGRVQDRGHSLSVRLASHCEATREPGLRRAIARAMRAN